MFCSAKQLQLNARKHSNVIHDTAASSGVQQGSLSEQVVANSTEAGSESGKSEATLLCDENMDECEGLNKQFSKGEAECLPSASKQPCGSTAVKDQWKAKLTASDILETSTPMNSFLDDNFEDIFRNQGVLKNVTFSKTSNLDRLLATQSRMTSLRNHLSLSVTAPSPTLTTRSSPSLSDFQWFPSHASNMKPLKSPTFSMADIAVVIPPNVSDYLAETTDSQSFDNLSSELDCKIDGCNILVGNTANHSQEAPNSKLMNGDVIYTEVSNTDLKNDTNNALKTCKKSKNSTTHGSLISNKEDQLVSKCIKSRPLHKEKIANSTKLDSSNDTVAKKHIAKDERDNELQNTSSVNVKSKVSKIDGFVKTAVDCNNDRNVNRSSPDYGDAELSEFVGWNVVENSRSKLKRKQQARSSKTHLVNSAANSLTRQTNQNSNSPRKLEEKPVRPRTLKQSPTKPTIQNNQQSSPCTQAVEQTVILTSSCNAAALAKSNTASCSTEIMQVPPAIESYAKPNICATSEDNANSDDLEPNQPQIQTVSTVSDCTSVKNIMVAASDCEKMSVAENDSSAATAGLNSHVTLENAATTANNSENCEVKEEGVKQGQENEMKEASGSEDHSTEANAAPPKLTGEELTKQLKNQLEYYFSRENLAQDPYLVSQMNPEQYVSIYTIANFKAIKKLTSDIKEVIEALKVEVDENEEMVRPNPNRCAVLLREIPTDVKQEEVTALFTDCPTKFSYFEYAGNTNWYVYFDSENDAQTAYRHLREKVREFKGKPILARIKTKTHHLNTYSFQNLPSHAQEPKEQTAPTNTSESPQVSQPVDYIHPQSLFVCPPSPFPSPHPSSQVAAIPTSLIARVAAQSPAVPVPSSGQGPTPAMAMIPHFSGLVSPWPAQFYPPEAPVMGSIAGQFLQPAAFKTAPVARYSQAQIGGGTPMNNSSGHRFTDFHKLTSQRNTSYSQQRKSLHSNYNQQHNSNTQSKSQYYLSSDPNPPNPSIVSEMMGHYVQSEHGATHVTHTMTTPHPAHYLPAVNPPFARPPFIASGASDPNYVLVPQAHLIHPPPNVSSRHGSRRGPGQSYQNYRSSNSYSHHEQAYTGVNSAQRSRHNNHRSSNYHQEISPRFIQKGVAPYGMHGQVSSSHMDDMSGHETKSYSSSRSNNNGNSTSNSQRQRTSPNNDNHASDKTHGYTGSKDHYSDATANDDGKRASQSSNMSNSEQKNSHSHQVGLEQRRNSRQRRGKRNDDERTPSTTAPPAPPVNTTFNLESNSFPPLPGSGESEAQVPSSQSPESRPATTEPAKGSDAAVKTSSPTEVAPPPIVSAPPPKKYSEVSSASHVVRPPISHPKPAAEEPKPVKKPDVKVGPAVNTQTVADKHPPITNKRTVPSKPAVTEKKPVSDAPKPPPSHPRSNSASSAGHSAPNPSKKLSRNPSIPKENKSAPVSKPDPAPKPEAKKEALSRHNSDVNEVKPPSKDESSEEKDSNNSDGSDRKPTYAEIMKARKATQVNGKALSDSGKSDSGDDNRSVEEAKDSDAKAVETEKVTKPSSAASAKPEKDDDQGKPDRKPMNGPARRGDYDHRWHGRPFRDRNNDFRGGRGRDRPFSGDRGGWGRGGYRRRGGFRGNYHNNYSGGGRTVPTSQPSAER